MNDKALAFAARHGSFTLYFDSTVNQAEPDYTPWTLELADDDIAAGSGLTAEEAIDAAMANLAETSDE